MTELLARLREDAPDEEDVLLGKAFADLQMVVDDFLSRTGRSVNDLNENEQQALVDAIEPHLAFELKVSQDIYVGLPIVSGGPGGFLLADSQGALLGAQQTTDGDVITGMVSEVHAYPVPSLGLMLESANSDEDVPVYDQSLSAVIILSAAKFHTHPSEDGTFQTMHDLDGMQIMIPIVYGMKTRVSDIDI